MQHDFGNAAKIASALQARLSEVTFPLDPLTERAIRRQVCDYADELKRLGLPPERVIVALKRLANEAGVVSMSRTIATPKALDGHDKLLVDIVAWCIDRYYSRDERTG